MHSKTQNEHDALTVVCSKVQNQLKRVQKHMENADKLFEKLILANEKKSGLIAEYDKLLETMENDLTKE